MEIYIADIILAIEQLKFIEGRVRNTRQRLEAKLRAYLEREALKR